MTEDKNQIEGAVEYEHNSPSFSMGKSEGDLSSIILSKVLLYVSAILFLPSILFPAFSKVSFLVFERSASIGSLILTAAQEGRWIASAIGILFYLAFPIYALRKCWLGLREIRKSKPLGEKLRTPFLLNKFKILIAAFLLLPLAISPLVMSDGYSFSVGAYLYTSFVVLFLAANYYLVKSVAPDLRSDASHAAKSLAIRFAGIFGCIMVVGIAFVTWLGNDGTKESVPAVRSADAPLPVASSPRQTREGKLAKDLQRIYSGMRTYDSFDVGGYCRRAIRGTDVTLQQCMGIFVQKARDQGKIN